MISESAYLSSQEQLKKYINLLFDSSEFFKKEKKKKELGRILSECLSFFNYLGEKTNKFKNEIEVFSKRYLQAFGKDYKSEIEKEDEFKFKSEEDLKDYLNYTRIAVKNAFDLDIDQANLQEKLSEKIQESPKKYPKSGTSLLVYKNFLATDFSAKARETNGEFIEDFLLKSHAIERLNKDINDGNIYIYKTKPKLNINIKYLLMSLISIGILISFALFISTIVSFATSGQQASSSLAVLSLMAFFYLLYIFFYHIRTFRNENFKYSFQKKDFFSFFLFSLVFSILNSYGSTNLTQGLNGMMIPVMVLFILLFFIVLLALAIYFFSYLYLNPPKDEKLISEQISKHMESLSEKE